MASACVMVSSCFMFILVKKDTSDKRMASLLILLFCSRSIVRVYYHLAWG
jgi:hypothetical protein